MPKKNSDLEKAAALEMEGRLDHAETLLRGLIAARPLDPVAYHRLALLKARSGMFAEARHFATEALQADQAFAPAHVVLGRLYLEEGVADAALNCFARALAIAPDDADALFAKGTALRRQGRNLEALESYRAALAQQPTQPELLCNHGNVLQDLGRHAEALESFDRALVVSPQTPVLHYNRGNALMSLGRHEEAIRSFDTVIRMDPRSAEAWNNRGNAELELGRAEASLQSFGRAIALDPEFVDAHANRGNALLELDRPRDAIEDFSIAISGEPDNAAAHNGMGMALQRTGAYDAAHRYFGKALEFDPSFFEARHNQALLRLFECDFGQAWHGYESRLVIPGYRRDLRNDPRTVDLYEQLPQWHGPDGKAAATVAIWAEQGIGDQILFSTMLPELIATGQSFAYEVDRRLLPVYRRSFPESDFIALDDPPADVLRQSSAVLFAGSLPGFFRRTAGDFSRQPRKLLQASPQRVEHYAARLGDGFRVALSWRSRRSGWVGRSKSVELADMTPLFAVPGVRWVDVQYGDTTDERTILEREGKTQLVHFDEIDYRENLEEVLALLAACDLLITTSNVSAHFAGALGKPVWLLYPAERPPFHYWAHRGDHRCLWYPSVEFIPAPDFSGWPGVIAAAAARLRAECAP